MSGAPIGAVMPYAAPVNTTEGSAQSGYPSAVSRAYDLYLARHGWLVCDGRAVAIARYPALFHTIGFIYGKQGAGFFRLPDYRGRSLRGVNYDAAGPDTLLRDPDAAQRLPSAAGGWTGNQVGSVQDDALQAHEHLYKLAIVGGAAAEGAPVFGNYQAPEVQTTSLTAPQDFSPTITVRQAAETRVKNVSVNFIIKYADSPWRFNGRGLGDLFQSP